MKAAVVVPGAFVASHNRWPSRPSPESERSRLEPGEGSARGRGALDSRPIRAAGQSSSEFLVWRERGREGRKDGRKKGRKKEKERRREGGNEERKGKKGWEGRKEGRNERRDEKGERKEGRKERMGREKGRKEGVGWEGREGREGEIPNVESTAGETRARGFEAEDCDRT